MSEISLVSHKLCPYVQRAAIALMEKEVAFERIDIDLADKPGWFTAISPLGKVPLLTVDDNVIFESAVIVEYLEETENPPMHPGDPLERARHRAWIEFASTILNDIWKFYVAPEADALETGRQTLIKRFEWLDRNLASGPYFAGSRFHLVDSAYAPVFRYFDVFERIADFRFFDRLANVQAYREALAGRPSVAAAVSQDYPERLWDFLRARDSALSRLMVEKAA